VKIIVTGDVEKIYTYIFIYIYNIKKKIIKKFFFFFFFFFFKNN